MIYNKIKDPYRNSQIEFDAKPTKTIKREAIYTCNVNKKRLLFDYITLKHVIRNFILHLKWFMRLGNPNVTIQVKLAKLASIPPRWANHTPTNPKWP